MDTNFFHGFEMGEQCIISIKVGSAVVQQVQVPEVFAPQQMMQIIQQICNDTKPMSCECRVYDTTDTGKKIENKLTYYNLVASRNMNEENNG